MKPPKFNLVVGGVLGLLVPFGAVALAVAIHDHTPAMSQGELATLVSSQDKSVVGVTRHRGAGGVYYTVQLAPTAWLASGNRAYIVDATGRIAAYEADVGDAPTFRERWLLPAGEPADRAELARVMQGERP